MTNAERTAFIAVILGVLPIVSDEDRKCIQRALKKMQTEEAKARARSES